MLDRSRAMIFIRMLKNGNDVIFDLSRPIVHRPTTEGGKNISPRLRKFSFHRVLRSRKENKERERRKKGGEDVSWKTFLGISVSRFHGTENIKPRFPFFPLTLRDESRRAYHSQPIINCAWRNILTASFLPVFKAVQRKKERKDRKKE